MAASSRVFPRHLALASPTDTPSDASTLSCLRIKASEWTDAQYWRKLCPELTVSDGLTAGPAPITLASSAVIRGQVDAEGAALVHADELPWQGLDFAALARSVVRLMQYGWPASFILMYDEAWSLVHQLGSVMEATTGNRVNLDILAWYIDPNQGGAGFSPHRDRQPPSVPSSFRPDGSARYTTAWVPFTDACPENSCLYVLPRWADPGYHAGDAEDGPDPLPLALDTKESYQNIRALPAEAGAAVIFTHRIIHWGSKGRVGYPTPRISLSFGCADDTYEPPYFDREHHLPYPSVAMRAALTCGQMIAYHERFDLAPKQLAMFRRVFSQQSDHFHPSYRHKVLEEYVSATQDVAERHAAKTTAATSQAQTNGGAAGPSAARQAAAQAGAAAGDERLGSNGHAAAVTSGGVQGDGEAVEKESKKKKKAKRGVDGNGDVGAQGRGEAAAGSGAGTTTNSSKAGDAAAAGGGVNGTVGKEKKKDKKDKKKKPPPKPVEEGEEEDDEDEGPGFESQLCVQGSDVDSDVDLLDDALDALLEAKAGGFDDMQDDFDEDMMEGPDDYQEEDDDDDDDDEEEEEEEEELLITSKGKQKVVPVKIPTAGSKAGAGRAPGQLTSSSSSPASSCKEKKKHQRCDEAVKGGSGGRPAKRGAPEGRHASAALRSKKAKKKEGPRK